MALTYVTFVIVRAGNEQCFFVRETCVCVCWLVQCLVSERAQNDVWVCAPFGVRAACCCVRCSAQILCCVWCLDVVMTPLLYHDDSS